MLYGLFKWIPVGEVKEFKGSWTPIVYSDESEKLKIRAKELIDKDKESLLFRISKITKK